MNPYHSRFPLRPASREEAGLFYSDDQADRALGTVGHVRMDFGSNGRGFYHTWWPHNGDRFNTSEFKEALQQFVDAMRADGPLKDLPSMDKFCRQNGGAITEDGRSYGYLAEVGNYRFCLRCTPSPGEYQCYLYCACWPAPADAGQAGGPGDLCQRRAHGVYRPAGLPPYNPGGAVHEGCDRLPL
ncbi:MAG: hypothetical protein ACLRWQ_07885 [Flavonifractor plautii]